MSLWDFGGETFDEERDGERLGAQLERVKRALQDGEWHTLADLSELSRGSEASASARIRDLRKAKFGGHDIEREYVANGVWHYRMVR